LRQVYRTNSSTFGQKHKNQKKAEQKRRKAARRSSEGDTPSSDSRSLTFSADESEDQDHTNDSGLASEDIEGSSCSPMEANNNMKIVVKTTKQSGKNKGKRPKVASRFLDESQNSDLIFNLDFYWISFSVKNCYAPPQIKSAHQNRQPPLKTFFFKNVKNVRFPVLFCFFTSQSLLNLFFFYEMIPTTKNS